MHAAERPSVNIMVRFLRYLIVCIAVCGVAHAGSEFAERLYKEGIKAERAGDVLHAYLLFARAAALDPANLNYAAHKAALRGDSRNVGSPGIGAGIDGRIAPGGGRIGKPRRLAICWRCGKRFRQPGWSLNREGKASI